MGGLVVHAHAGGGGEAGRELGGRPGAVLAQHGSADGVEVGGGHAGRRRGQHRVAGLGDGPRRPFQPAQVVLTVDRHASERYRQVARQWVPSGGG